MPFVPFFCYLKILDTLLLPKPLFHFEKSNDTVSSIAVVQSLFSFNPVS